MAYWWVSQNKTGDEEHAGGYLWAPIRNEQGQTPFHWANMEQLAQGDVVFCYLGQAITAVAVVRGPAYRSAKPFRSEAGKTWEDEGWRADVDYDPLDPPLPVPAVAAELRSYLPSKYSPLTRDGTGVQGYLFSLPEAAAHFLLSHLDREPPLPTLLPKPTILHDIANAMRPRRAPKGTSTRGEAPFVRRSREAKRIGDQAESIVLEWLRSTVPGNAAATLRWVANDGRQPGWDIEYELDDGLQVVEVKGTTAPRFESVEITSNEWAAAVELRERYSLVLVTDCMGSRPGICLLRNPARLREQGQLDLAPVLLRLAWTPVSQ